MTLDVLIIGQGAIGSYVAERLADVPEIAIRWALVRPGREDRARAVFGTDVKPITTPDQLDARPDVALECAGHGAPYDTSCPWAATPFPGRSQRVCPSSPAAPLACSNRKVRAGFASGSSRRLRASIRSSARL